MKKTLITIFLLLSTSLYAQNMEMYDTDGKHYKVYAKDDTLQIEHMKGKVVFLEFFGLRCPACKELMPNLIKVQEKYPNKLKVLGIEVQNNDIEPINEYKKRYGINYTTFSNYDVGRVVRYIADNADWAGAIPFLVVIDSEGKVQVLKRGVISKETLENYVKRYAN
ncbi:MAG TPA: TlpA family protein disulfide reductase [Campylobacterales bacterium]|nr:TlpA family protein disulfide reductase [Campylobacterales bacterium]